MGKQRGEILDRDMHGKQFEDGDEERKKRDRMVMCGEGRFGSLRVLFALRSLKTRLAACAEALESYFILFFSFLFSFLSQLGPSWLLFVPPPPYSCLFD